MRKRVTARKVVVPIALAVTIVASALTLCTAAVTIATSAGCDDDDGPKVDAGPPDTPIV